jgi:DNA processing protein
MTEAGIVEERADKEAGLIDLLGASPIAIDDLVWQSGLPIRTVQMTLLELAIAGRVERHGGNAVSLIAGR